MRGKVHLKSIIFSLWVGTSALAAHSYNDPAAISAQPPRDGSGYGIPESYRIPDYGTPLIYQRDYLCFLHSGRGVIEYLVNRAHCDDPSWGGVRSLNQNDNFVSLNGWSQAEGNFVQNSAEYDGTLAKLTTPLSMAKQASVQKLLGPGNEVEADHLFTSKDGYIKEPETFDADRDTRTNFGFGLIKTGLNTLFGRINPVQRSASQLWNAGGITDYEVNKIKAWMYKHKSPVYFIFMPVTRNNGYLNRAGYWHAAYITGWNKNGFIVRDSSFGQVVNQNGRSNRDLTVMNYQYFKDSAKGATGYRLRTDNNLTCVTPGSSDPNAYYTSAVAGTDHPSNSGGSTSSEQQPFSHDHPEPGTDRVDSAPPQRRSPPPVPNYGRRPSASRSKPKKRVVYHNGVKYHYYRFSSGKTPKYISNGRQRIKVTPGSVGFYVNQVTGEVNFARRKKRG